MSTIYLSEKKEYRALDFSKFVAAFLVAAIHIPPFEEIAPVFSHEFQQVICRMAVPFFFVCAGYFIGEKITDSQSWSGRTGSPSRSTATFRPRSMLIPVSTMV